METMSFDRVGVGRVAPVELTDLDEQLLELVSWLRVVTQTQLERLFSDVPDRTLRYRTRRLSRLGLLGRSRPYRERGSAPHHLWPTSRGDALVRSQPPPRRGERGAPSLLFLAHSAAISELYVVMRTEAAVGQPTLTEFLREGEAREAFKDGSGRERVIAPDVRIGVRYGNAPGRAAYVELDLGTMSHARLRAKLDGYLAHAEYRARAGVEGPAPALLFVTTSARRAETFRRTSKRALAKATGPTLAERMQIAVCAGARRPNAVFTARCWQGTEDDNPSTLCAVLAP